MAALVCNLRLANDDVLARVRADEAALRAYFGGLAKPDKARCCGCRRGRRALLLRLLGVLAAAGQTCRTASPDPVPRCLAPPRILSEPACPPLHRRSHVSAPASRAWLIFWTRTHPRALCCRTARCWRRRRASAPRSLPACWRHARRATRTSRGQTSGRCAQLGLHSPSALLGECSPAHGRTSAADARRTGALKKKGVPSAAFSQILEQCREVYAERAGRTAAATDAAAEASAQQMAAATAAAAAAKGGGRAPSAREAAFRAAVSAARKRSNVVPAAAPAWPEAPQTAAPQSAASQSAAQSPMAGLSLGVVMKKTG